MAWSVMIFETLIGPLSMFGGKATALALMMGVLFHLLNAIFMGLNGFLISFLAAYPIAWSLLALNLSHVKGSTKRNDQGHDSRT